MKEVSLCDRCISKRADEVQCTRRKKAGLDYCGTHSKNSPNGEVEVVSGDKNVEVWVEDIAGIIRYVDAEGNKYNVEDVLAGKPNPRKV